MRRNIQAILILSILFTCKTLMAQEVKLDYTDQKNRVTVYVKLYDSYNGSFLIELPLTFHITQDNVLFMIIGDDVGIGGRKTVWLFDKIMDLKELKKRNKNLEFSGSFKKHHKKVYPFFKKNENLEMSIPFQNNFECVQNMPKPIFFDIAHISDPIELRLKFYISTISDKNKYAPMLIAEAGIIKTNIVIIK